MTILLILVGVAIGMVISYLAAAVLKKKNSTKTTANAQKTTSAMLCSYDILLAVLAELGCRIQADEPCEEVDKNGRILSFVYKGGKFIVRVSKETQFVLLRFLIKTEVEDMVSLFELVNCINDIEVLYKAFVCRDEDRSNYIELDYSCMSVTSQDIITAIEDMLHLYVKVQNTLIRIESTDRQDTSADADTPNSVADAE